jgi:hypothetical protein
METKPKRKIEETLRVIAYVRFFGQDVPLGFLKDLMRHVWKIYPPYFKGVINGRRCLWRVSDRGTGLVPLSSLAIEELLVHSK